MSILTRLKLWAAGITPRQGPPPGMIETPLDKLSNSVMDAIEAGHYDEAQMLCQRLLREYPDVLDGHERLAILRKAQGRFKEAAQHYSKVLEMIKKDPAGTDRDTEQYIMQERDQALARAKG